MSKFKVGDIVRLKEVYKHLFFRLYAEQRFIIQDVYESGSIRINYYKRAPIEEGWLSDAVYYKLDKDYQLNQAIISVLSED